VDRERVLIIGPNPTPNGNLHIGHIAGPYLAGDVYARWQRACGREVIYTTGTDDSQTYVVASARRQGTTPEALCARSTQQISQTLRAVGISIDGFGPFDGEYRSTVLRFFEELHAAGKFKLRKVLLPYSEQTDEFMVEGLVEGNCPICLAVSRGGLCETCGLPNNFDELHDVHSAVNRDEHLALREATILVFPLEDYRDQLEAYHRAKAACWRPHIVQMAREALARPLPDFPITYPLAWGIPAPFPETPGQVLNAWAETIPAGMFTAAYAATQLGLDAGRPGDIWRAETDRRLVHFLGFDNAWFWSVAYVALLMAHGDRYVLPDAIVPNEFYELENEKLSTSKGHVVWAEDLVDDVPRDLVRFYLALTAPDHQRTTFSRSALEKVVRQRLVTPWNSVVRLLEKGLADVDDIEAPLPVSMDARRRAATMMERFTTAYELPAYSLTRAAEVLLVQLDRLHSRAVRLTTPAWSVTRAEDLGDLLLEVAAFVAGASPVLIDLADGAPGAVAVGRALRGHPLEIDAVRAFALPLFGLEADAASSGIFGWGSGC
jgi:methionyl-tRNA synthetase